MEKFFVAYQGSDGSDFYGDPWIFPENTFGYDSQKEAENAASDLSEMGMQRVTVFKFIDDELTEEIISWDFVDKHAV